MYGYGIPGRSGSGEQTDCLFQRAHGSWSFPGGGSADPKKREEFFRKTWQFRKNPELLAAGNYEWPFELVVPGQTTESLEGLPDSWVIYRLKATIDRGFFHQNCAIRRQVRIIRTLDPAALELAHAMVGLA